ncbi:MAG: SprT-like domain-containing protein [Nanoarchaeota archaeon]
MELAKEAYCELFGKEPDYEFILKYSGKFNDYNGNVKQRGRRITFGLSRSWRNIDSEIQKGILQSLLCRLFRFNKTTINIEMYNNFIKNLHICVPDSDKEAELLESFERVNGRFFGSVMDIACLKWANFSKRCFGTYEYGTDTIKINPVLSGRTHLLDYVMFHEMLHKRFKFDVRGNRHVHHSKKFRDAEKSYPERDKLEMELTKINRFRF